MEAEAREHVVGGMEWGVGSRGSRVREGMEHGGGGMEAARGGEWRVSSSEGGGVWEAFGLIYLGFLRLGLRAAAQQVSFQPLKIK